MAGTRTNSNSITSILIEKLNNVKSGFRSEMLKEWNLPANTIFSDGTHSSVPIKEMGNKEVDIVGYSNNEICVLIEVKANKEEDLQPSQGKNGEYEKVIAKHPSIKLFYILPNGYIHEDEIPEKAKKISWAHVYAKAREYDNSGLKEQIESFVDNSFNNLDMLINKGDIIMLMNPSLIDQVLSLYHKFNPKQDDSLMDRFIKDNPDFIKVKTKEPYDDFGFWYNISSGKKQVELWIGLASFEHNEKESLYIYTNDDKKITVKENKDPQKPDYYSNTYDGNWRDYFFPVRNDDGTPLDFLFAENADEQQEKFNTLLKSNLKKVLAYIK